MSLVQVNVPWYIKWKHTISLFPCPKIVGFWPAGFARVSSSQYQYQFILAPSPAKSNKLHFRCKTSANKIQCGTKGDHERARRSPSHGHPISPSFVKQCLA